MNALSIKNTPKDIFLHLFNIVTCYMSVVSYIMLLLAYITLLFPDPLHYYLSGILNSIFWSTSILIVAFAAYIATSWLMEREMNHEPAKRDVQVRKWLVYLTLFISAITILGDLIALLFNFLNGELTLPFFLKIMIVLGVATAVFGYYFWDLNHHDKKASLRRTQIAQIASAAILISIAFGFIIAGTPATQRARRFDEQRINDLQMIQSQIVNYWIPKNKLPPTLQELENPLTGFALPRDPDTQLLYDYQQINELKFELCADFQTDGMMQDTSSPSYFVPKPLPPARSIASESWHHSKGHTCFTRTIDPELYKSQTEKPSVPVRL